MSRDAFVLTPVVTGTADTCAGELPASTKPVPWNDGRDRSGYGRRIATRYIVHYNGRWRRVYCHCYSNAGTCYIDGPDGWIVVRDVKING